MHRLYRRRVAGLVALALALACTACGTSAPKGVSASNVKQLPVSAITGTYLGLTPEREDVRDNLSSQEGNSYISGVGLYSLRKGEELEATLQISKLSSNARPEDEDFQELVAGQIGGTTVQAYSMGGRTVFRSSLRKQSLSSWFRGEYFMILSVRETYKTPRALLRVLLDEVDPK